MHPRGGGVSTGFPGPYIPFPSTSLVCLSILFSLVSEVAHADNFAEDRPWPHIVLVSAPSRKLKGVAQQSVNCRGVLGKDATDFRNLHLWCRPSGLDEIHQVQRVAFSTTKKDFEEGVEAPHETGVRLEGLEDWRISDLRSEDSAPSRKHCSLGVRN